MMRSNLKRVRGLTNGLAGDTIWAGVRDFSTLVVTLLSFFMLQRVLDRETYAGYITVFAISAPLGALSFHGPGLALLTSLVRDRLGPKRTLSEFLSSVLATSSVAMLVGLALSLIIVDDLNFGEIFFLLGSELLGSASIVIIGAFVHAKTGFASMARLHLGILVIRFVVLSILVVSDSRLSEQIGLLDSIQLPYEKGESLTILNIGVAYFVGFILYSFLALKYVERKYEVPVSLNTAVTGAFKKSLSFSIPMGADQLKTNGDKVILRSFGFVGDTGLYGAAYRVILLGMAPLRAVNAAVFERFLPQDDAEQGVHLQRSIKFTVLTTAVSVLVAIVIFFALPFIDFLFGEDFIEATEIVPWLLPLIPLIALSNTPLNGLVGLGRDKERTWLYIAAAIFSLVSYFALIPPFGWPGAVAGTLLSETVLGIFSWILLVRYQKHRNSEISEEDDNQVVSHV